MGVVPGRSTKSLEGAFVRIERALWIAAAVGTVLALVGVFTDASVVTDIGACILAVPAVIVIARLFVKPPSIMDVVEPETIGLPRYEEPTEVSSAEAKSTLRDNGAEYRPK